MWDSPISDWLQQQDTRRCGRWLVCVITGEQWGRSIWGPEPGNAKEFLKKTLQSESFRNLLQARKQTESVATCLGFKLVLLMPHTTFIRALSRHSFIRCQFFVDMKSFSIWPYCCCLWVPAAPKALFFFKESTFKYLTMSWMFRQRWHLIYSMFYHFQGRGCFLPYISQTEAMPVLLFHACCADAEISLANFNILGLFAPQLLLVCCTPAWTAIWESHINSRGSGPVWWGASLCSLALTTQVLYPFIKDS